MNTTSSPASFDIEMRLDEIEKSLQTARRIAATRGGGTAAADRRIDILMFERASLLRSRNTGVSST